MTLLAALILGIIQGLTEFIPISSTAHLTLAGTLMGVIDPNRPEQWTAFIATIQLGTLAAVFVYFKHDVLRMIVAFFTEICRPWRVPVSEWSGDARQTFLVIIGTVPIVVIGLAIKEIIEGSFTKNPIVMAVGLIGIGLLLWIAERRATMAKKLDVVSVADSIIIGLAQALALIPGASRSGSTIMAGLFRGLNREDAARFSFLLSIPAVLGAGVFEFLGEVKYISWELNGAALLLATIVSMISGYYSIGFLLRYLRTRSLKVFIIYRLALGVVLLATGCQPTTHSESGTAEIQTEQGVSVPATVNTILPDSAEITNYADVITSMGTFRIGLYGNDAPQTVENFMKLVKKKYYNHTLIHRVVKDFVIQMGDPTTRDPRMRAEWGRGGHTANGKPLPEELDSLLPSAKLGYHPGAVAMARRAEPGSGTSQFFICLDKAKNLPYQYTIFGRIVKGLDVVRKISEVEVEPGSFGELDPIPDKPIRIKIIRQVNRFVH